MVRFQMQIGQTTPALNMPQWVWSLALPLGALLCFIRTIQVLIIELKEVGGTVLQHDVTVEGEKVL